MDTVRFGVIGLNRGSSYARVCAAVGGARVTALHDIDHERAERAAAELGAEAFADLDGFLAADIDAVVVASPVPFHAGQAAAALAAGKHVLSEVTACATMEDARTLIGAARGSDAVYMMAENYRYLDEVELLKRLHAGGRFGGVYFGEGEYLHDVRDLFRDAVGNPTWRGTGGLGVYCTHSLGPLLYILDDRVRTVSALAAPDEQGEGAIPAMHLMQMVTDGGVTLRVRVDVASPRPHQMAWYALQGTAGSYEAWRGLGDESKLWLGGEHEPSRASGGARWHPLAQQAQRYIPDRLAAPPGAREGGHGTSEYWLMRDFLAAIRGERPSPIDADRALDYTLPGIAALASAANGGAPVEVPDSREW